MQLLRKITTKTVYGDKEAILDAVMSDKGKPHILYRIGGEATAAKTGVSDNGEWTALLGRFRAVNAKTGEVFQSMKAFLPSFLTEGLAAQLNGADAEPVSFLFDITAQFDKESATSYVYGAVELLPPTEGDTVEALFGRPNVPALPAPAPLAGKKKGE